MELDSDEIVDLFCILLNLTKLKDNCEAARASYAAFIPNLSEALLDFLTGMAWGEGLDISTRIRARILIDEQYRGQADQPSFADDTEEELILLFAEIYTHDTGISRNIREEILAFLVGEYLKQDKADSEAVRERGQGCYDEAQRAREIILTRTPWDDDSERDSVLQSVGSPPSTVPLGATSDSTPQAFASQPSALPTSSLARQPPPSPRLTHSTRTTSASDPHEPSTPHGQASTSSPPFPSISPLMSPPNRAHTESGSAGGQLSEGSRDSEIGPGPGVNLRGRHERSMSPTPEDDDKRRKVRRRD